MKKHNFKLFSFIIIPLLVTLSFHLDFNAKLKTTYIEQAQTISQITIANQQLDAKIEVANQELTSLNTAKSSLTSQIVDATNKFVAIKTKVDDLESAYQQILQLNKSLEDNLVLLTNQLDAKRRSFGGGGGGGGAPAPVVDPRIAELANLNNTYNSLLGSYQSLVNKQGELSADLIFIEDNITIKLALVSSLDISIDDLNLEKEDLNELLESSLIELASLNEVTEEIVDELAAVYIASLEKEISELNQLITTKTNLINAKTAERNQLLDDVNEASDDKKILEDLKLELTETTIPTLEATIALNQQQISDLNASKANLIKIKSDLETNIELYQNSQSDEITFALMNQITNQAIKASVRVETQTNSNSIFSAGSGVVYQILLNEDTQLYDYYILTNYHVVDRYLAYPNTYSIKVRGYNGALYNGLVIKHQVGSNVDLALVKVSHESNNILGTLALATSEPIVSQLAISLGNPRFQVNTITVGKILSTSSNVMVSYNNYLEGTSTTYVFNTYQHSALIDSGNSGGALLDANLNIIAINFAGSPQTNTFPFQSVNGYAIKLSHILQFVNNP